jgi:hypothetical protein
MSLKASEQIALDAIEHYLRTADPELSIAFESFASVTAHTQLPESEQLGGSQTPAIKPPGGSQSPDGSRSPDGPPAERTKLTFTMWLAILFLVGMVLAGMVLALFSGGRQSSCPGATAPGFAQAKAASGLLHGRALPSCTGYSRSK